MSAATLQFLRAIRDAVRPDRKVWIDEWAQENRTLPPDSPEPGKWRNSRTPYLVDIMRTMSPQSHYREGWVKKGVQLGGSAAGENFIGGSICTAAGSMLVVFATLDDAKQWEMTRFAEMRANTPALKRRIRDAHAKGSGNSKLRKRYPGGVMRLVGANRVGAIKSSTIRYIKFEEPDEYPLALGGQGDTITNVKKRASNFGRKAKIYGDGTPTIAGRSAIDTQYERGDKRHWHLNCPGCSHAQPLEWSGMRWVDGDPTTALYHCKSCDKGFAEHVWKGRNYARPEGCSEPAAKAAGHAYWEATAAGEPGVASWKLPSLAAPVGWRPWVDLVTAWLDAQGDEEKLKSFYNNELAECWTDTIGTTVGADALQKRAENYGLMTCPQRGLVLVAGVDTQDNRVAIVFRAFGRGEESWGVWHSEIYGDPSTPEVWGKLRELLDAPVRHASGQVMRVDAAFIDAGGHHGEDVYAFCRDAQLRGKHWCAIRGAKSYDAPKLGRPKNIEFTWRGKPVPGGVVLRHLGTQSIKHLIDGRLKLELQGDGPSPGCYHFPLGFEADYYKQVRAEKRELKRDKQGNKALWWVKGTTRNEAWDCEVYAYGAFLYVMSGRHAEQVWRMREKLYAPRLQRDLLEEDGEIVASGQFVVNQDTGEIVGGADPAAATANDQAGQGGDAPPAEVKQEQPRAPKPSQPKPKPKQPKPPRQGGFVRGWAK